MATEIRTPTHALAVGKILHSQHTCLRAALDPGMLRDLSELVEEGIELPPALVYHDGQRYWLADGEHTIRTLDARGVQLVPCEVRKGSRADALAAGLERHRSRVGLRWTREDRQHAARLLLRDPEARRWSNYKIADLAGYKSEKDIRQLRGVLECQEAVERERERKRQEESRPRENPQSPPAGKAPGKKITFEEEKEEAPKQETRQVEVKRGPHAGRTYELPVKPKKELPARSTVRKARRQLPRTGTKFERQTDGGELDLVEVLERWLAGARKGIPFRRIFEDYLVEVGE